MERWLDTKSNYWAYGFMYVALCVITYAACIQCESPHPWRTTLIVAAGLPAATLLISVSLAVVFAPLLALIARLSVRRKDEKDTATDKPAPDE